DYGFRLAGAVLQGYESQPVGVGVALNAEHLRDDDLVAVPDRAEFLVLDVQPFRWGDPVQAYSPDLQPGERQALHQLGHRKGEVNVVAQPAEGDFHDGVPARGWGAGGRGRSELAQE